MTSDHRTRVAYLGNYRHPWTTESHVARELESLGCYVDRIQEPPGGGDAAFVKTLYSRVISTHADLLLWTRTWGIHESAIKHWRRLESGGIQTASLHLDLYRGLKRQRNVNADPFWRTGTVFTADGDPQSQQWFESMDINHVWSPAAVFSDECTPGYVRAKYAKDVVFVGTPAHAYHPEWSHREKLLDHLERRYGDRFMRWGGHDLTVRGLDLNDLYATAKVVVGDSLALPGHVNYWSDRPYETIGRGGYLLMTHVPGLEQHFTDGQHLRFWTAGDFEQLDHLIEQALVNDDERLRTSTHGQAHVIMHHTYQHRLRDVLSHLRLDAGQP